MYGDWKVTDRDISEVLIYRGGVVGTAVCTLLVTTATATDFLDLSPATIDALCVAGALSFGASLALIHMYVTEIKRVIQLLFVAGVIGGGALMATQEGSVPAYVAAHPVATLLVGPAFAAVTGIAVKEGLCYGKPEAAALAVVRSQTPKKRADGCLPAIPPGTQALDIFSGFCPGNRPTQQDPECIWLMHCHVVDTL
jgi:uncharacterized integral membrane protein